MLETVLIAGGSGLLGKALQTELGKVGYNVKLLGRGKPTSTIHYQWDPSKQIIDETAFEGVNYIINLAGSNVGEGRWTEKRKLELLNSRIDSTRLLVNKCIELKLPIKKFIQASAIGYYGLSKQDVEFNESDEMGTDFLATLTGKWEAETGKLNMHNIPLLIIRIGVVLSNKGGALIAMSRPVKGFLGTALGSGKQFIPWIHIEDVVEIIKLGLKSPDFAGIYNAVSPNPQTNLTFMKLLADDLNRPLWPINVPQWALKVILGEQSMIVTGGNKISCEKLINQGYRFRYPALDLALKMLLNKPNTR